MSETLTTHNPDLAEVNAAQAAHEAGFIVTDNRIDTGVGVDFNGNPTFTSEAPAAPAPAVETPAVEPSYTFTDKRRVTTEGELTPYGASTIKEALTPAKPAEVVQEPKTEVAPAPTASATETVAEVLNPDRALARLGKRMSRWANLLTGTADRRTAKQLASDKKNSAVNYAAEKAETTRDSAKKVATKVGVAAVLSLASSLDTVDQVTGYATEKKGAAKNFLTEKRAKAQAHKESLIQARAKLGETRKEVTEKAKSTAKFAGKAALIAGVGVGYTAYKAGQVGREIDKQSYEIGAKGVRKTIEVASGVSETTKVKVNRGKQAAKESIHQTLKNADARAANTIAAYHDNQMRKHTRKAASHQAKTMTGAHANNASFKWL